MSLTEKWKTGRSKFVGEDYEFSSDTWSLRCLLVIQVEMLSRQLSLLSLEFCGEVIAGKEHFGVVSEQMVFKIVKLEAVTKSECKQKREAVEDLSH